MSKKNTYVTLDPAALEKLPQLTPFILQNEEKDEAISLYGNLPLKEIILSAITNKCFIDGEPTRNGLRGLKKTAYHHPMNMDITEGEGKTYLRPCDIKQGNNGNCWFLGVIIAILAKPEGDKFISGMMRDMSQKIRIGDENPISIGKRVGLKDDNVILVRLFDGLNPKYILVNKSYINGDFRSQAPAYMQMLEKAFVGYFLNGNFQKADGGHEVVLFDAFMSGSGGKTIKLNLTEKREKSAREFSNLFNKKIKQPVELIKEIFNNNKSLIKLFKKFQDIAGYEDSKKTLTPDSVAALAREAGSKIKIEDTRIDLSEMNSIIKCLDQYAASLKDDLSYYPVFAAFLEELLTEISSLSFQGSTEEKEAVLKKQRPVVISFDKDKIKSAQKGRRGEFISHQGFISDHSFAVSHIAKMSVNECKDKKFTVVHLVNPWGDTGVTQIYSVSEQGLIPVKSKSNVSLVTIDDLIRLGSEIVYDPTLAIPELVHFKYVSEMAMSNLSGMATTTDPSSNSSSRKKIGLFDNNSKKTLPTSADTLGHNL